VSIDTYKMYACTLIGRSVRRPHGRRLLTVMCRRPGEHGGRAGRNARLIVVWRDNPCVRDLSCHRRVDTLEGARRLVHNCASSDTAALTSTARGRDSLGNDSERLSSFGQSSHISVARSLLAAHDGVEMRRRGSSVDVMIGPPPEFGRKGAWPPRKSALTEVARWPVLQVINRRPGRIQIRVDDDDWYRLRAGAAELRKSKDAGIVEHHAESIRFPTRPPDPIYLVCNQFWEREDPPAQLSPGTSVEVELSYRVGLTTERATEIGLMIGASTDAIPGISLKGETTSKSTARIAIGTERTVTRRITLSNPMDDGYRLVALWHFKCAVSRVTEGRPPEKAVQVAEFIASDALVTTYVDLRR
jgi:hypothetical protein